MISQKAIVKAEMLAWARKRAKVSLADAAKAAHVPTERLEAWERADSGDAPTLRQLRDLAAKYHFPLAVFYLPEPPSDFAPLRDFRRRTEPTTANISANLSLHIRNAYERREVALELFEQIGAIPVNFDVSVNIEEEPDIIASRIRKVLKVDIASQKIAARAKRSFDYWRKAIEGQDILVFVVGGAHNSVSVEEMRGFAIAKRPVPVIVVNGRDRSDGGKAFTLLHEFCHILLGESAISNGDGQDRGLPPADRRVERFCDAVAAATLMPRELLDEFSDVRDEGVRDWSDEQLRTMSRVFGASRHAILLRLVGLKRATWDHYRHWAEIFRKEQIESTEKEKTENKKVIVKQPVLLMSRNGRGFTRIVLKSYYENHITLSDVSGYLGAKVKYIRDLERAAFAGAE